MKKMFFQLLLSTLFVILPLFSGAQVDNENTSLSILISPANPRPQENVNLKLQSFSFDLNRSTITWVIDGIERQTGPGLKEFNFQAGRAGQPVSVGVIVETQTGQIFSRQTNFTPAGVDLIFEAVSYTPPFYKGRAMNINQGLIVVAAFPEIFDEMGRKFNTNELIFTWKKDGVVMGSDSGVAKNYFTYNGSVPVRDVEIEVLVSARNQNISAGRSVLIERGSPKIVFYENSPIYGLMTNRAIKGAVQMLSDEFTFVAVPYFYSVGYAGSPDLEYSWSLDRRSVVSQNPINKFTVRQESPGSGTARIGLSIKNLARIFQFGDSEFVINFQR
jgi:hypothetical protein